MIVGLFAMQFILASLIVFTTYMISNKFKSIEKSLEVYGNSRAYKTQSYVAFIEKVMRRYQDGIKNIGKDVDIESIIKATLYKEYIGKFPFQSVKNIAIKTTRLMWGIILIEGVVAFIDQSAGAVSTILMITIGILMTIIIEMFRFIKGIEEENDTIIMIVQDYIINIYPVEIRKKVKYKEIISLRTKVSELEKEIKIEEEIEALTPQKQAQEEMSNDELNMQDIAKLIGLLQ